MTNPARDRLLDAALAIAEETSWEAVRLHDAAERAGLSLAEAGVVIREKEDLVDAWFDRADARLLEAAATDEFLALPARDRLAAAIMAWLDALAPHRRVTAQMIAAKLEPGHVHYQIDGLLRVSRTVQWIREVAHRDARLPWRAVEESGLTALYLMTFVHWMRDGSENAERTRRFLERRLDGLGRIASLLQPLSGSTAAQVPSPGGTEDPGDRPAAP